VQCNRGDYAGRFQVGSHAVDFLCRRTKPVHSRSRIGERL
jgi:hypothetical protein